MDEDFEYFGKPPVVNAKMVSRSREKDTGKERYYLTIQAEQGNASASSFPIDISKAAWDHCVRYFELAKVEPKRWESTCCEYTHYHFHLKTYQHGSEA